MECNTAHTQCTIGLARRPCQDLTGWTELCQSHYDNEYNTYTHEVVWKKIGGVWRRSLGGGSTCAATGTDVKGCQVSLTTAEGSTQTSVTTKTVTCQTSAGDDEEQHQPVSLEELVSQTSATGDSMPEETGPPQLSDGLLAEVMSANPPQPFSPTLPLPPILSPLHSPVDTISHEGQSGSAADRSSSPPVLQREPVSSPLLMHPDFIDEFEILDVWSPPQVPQSPYYSDFLEDEVLSLCVYDTDLDFF
ncbi:hypothetical protein XENOCAPTIV_023756 [Xenoophorus captivus]|uniref:Uncharacterized protein n=1 Tax=Xenoophorus captivus TaxID=1517983 RepID=A0ABV0RRX5_9TELE